MTELLFNSWWLPVLILLVGVVVWVAGNKRSASPLRWAGLAIAAVGVLLLVASFLYETPARKVTRQSKELVKSVVDQDWNKLQSLLDAQVNLSLTNDSIIYHSRDELLKGAKEGTSKYGLRGASTNVEEVQKQGQMLTTTLQVIVDADTGAGHPVPTRWQLDWEKDESGNWTVHDIRCLEIGNTKGGDALQYIPKVH